MKIFKKDYNLKSIFIIIKLIIINYKYNIIYKEKLF